MIEVQKLNATYILCEKRHNVKQYIIFKNIFIFRLKHRHRVKVYFICYYKHIFLYFLHFFRIFLCFLFYTILLFFLLCWLYKYWVYYFSASLNLWTFPDLWFRLQQYYNNHNNVYIFFNGPCAIIGLGTAFIYFHVMRI